MDERTTVTMLNRDEDGMNDAARWAGAFLTGFKSIQTRRAYRRDLECWFPFCTAHHLHPFRGVRRTHLELYLRELEQQEATPAPGTLYRRVATLSSWFRWLEDEDVTIGNPAARIRRPQRHGRPQPWLNRNELTDLLAAAEDDGGDAYALVCLLGLNGLRVSEACDVGIPDLGGSRYQPTLRILGKGGKPAEVVLNPRTQQAVDCAVADRTAGPLLRNQWRHRMQPLRGGPTTLPRCYGDSRGPRASLSGSRPMRCAAPTSRSVCSKASLFATCNARPATPRPDTTVAYDQSERSFHKDPTFVLMAATAR